jgi:hypothetical protein
MNEIAGIAYTTAEFDKDGTCIRQPALPDAAREVIIVSHGWNNDRGEAEGLYRALFTNFAAVHQGGTDKYAIVGVIWPSKKFDFSPEQLQQGGQVAAAAAGGTSADIERAEVERSLQEFERVFVDSGKEVQLARLRELAPHIATPAAQTEFVETLRQIVADAGATSDVDGSDFFFGQPDSRAVFVNAKQASAEVGDGGAQGALAGAGLGDMFSGIGNAVSSLLNVSTYYEMKKRAGTVGTRGLAPLVDQFGARGMVEHIHLVGHSFGARLVTAAAMASTTPKLYSLSLLQAAFSHNGFSDIGYFRKVVRDKRLAGPIIVTHTENDQAVGKAYAIASRISRDAAEGLGDRNDRYGGLGRNGAVNMRPDDVSKTMKKMLDVGEPYALQKQVIHNLESSPYIADHGGVTGRQVAWAISQAIAS